MHLPIRVSPVLRIAIGDAAVTLTPMQGLRLAEDLARKSFRKVAQEAIHSVPVDKSGTATKTAKKRS